MDNVNINDQLLMNNMAASSFSSFVPSNNNNKQRGSLVLDADEALDISGNQLHTTHTHTHTQLSTHNLVIIYPVSYL